MHAPFITSSSQRVSRRTALRGLGVSLALPFLDCMSPVFARGESNAVPQRMLLISNNLGVMPRPFFPEKGGRNYKLSPYLQELREFRDDFSVISGLSHPGVFGGHSTENCFLTAARGPTRSGFRNTISLDQFAASRLGPVTRFPSLNLGINIDKANRSLSWTRDGSLIPAEDSPRRLFDKMFLRGDSAAAAAQVRRLDERGSILDTLLDDARAFQKGLGGRDKTRLDQYLSSVRDVEKRLQASRRWELRPKPRTQQSSPKDIADKKLFFEKFDLMLSTAQLALESDSTRIVTFMVDAFATPAFRLGENRNTSEGYHGLSHHGQAPAKVKQLEDADRRQMSLLRKLFKQLAERKEKGERLLDRTMVLFGSNMGDSNTHANTNLPILIAGGSFSHGRHLVFDRDRNQPLCNLFVSMLQRLGLETDRFGSSSGTLTGL